VYIYVSYRKITTGLPFLDHYLGLCAETIEERFLQNISYNFITSIIY